MSLALRIGECWSGEVIHTILQFLDFLTGYGNFLVIVTLLHHYVHSYLIFSQSYALKSNQLAAHSSGGLGECDLFFTNLRIGFVSGTGSIGISLSVMQLRISLAGIISPRTMAFSLFAVPNLGYPEGTNIIFTDSIPLLALVFKIVYKLTGWKFNYFGFWFLLCYTLQGVSAALLLHALGVRSLIANLCGVIVALSGPILLHRFSHAGLCGHFLIILSLWCYFTLVKMPKRWWVWGVFLTIFTTTVLIRAYLLIMVTAIYLATVSELLRQRGLALPAAAGLLI